LCFIGIGLRAQESRRLHKTLQLTRAQPSELNAGIVGAGG
jgi:hypothetical protein